MNDEFYVGYSDRCPAGTARFVRRLLAILGTGLVAVLAAVGGRQSPVGNGRFEFGHRRDFQGRLFEEPLPLLHVPGEDGAGTTFLLVGEGKRGLPDAARSQHGNWVRFRGTLIERDGVRMVEMGDRASFQVIERAATEPWEGTDLAGETAGATSLVDLGRSVLVGELVDTKCYFGVMRPATGKIHRACAVRCLSGGVPPGLLVRRSDGSAAVVMLATRPGGPAIDAQWAARTIRVRGRLEIRDGLPLLHVESAGLAGKG